MAESQETMHVLITCRLISQLSSRQRLRTCYAAVKGKGKEGHALSGRKEETQGTNQPVLVKKPIKWMTNCPCLATLLGIRCTCSGKFVANVSRAVGREKCHKLATLMPERFPYLSITVVLLIGETLLPHKDVQNHRFFFRNITALYGDWTGGVLQIEEDGE